VIVLTAAATENLSRTAATAVFSLG
jgi:hypothetical protein